MGAEQQATRPPPGLAIEEGKPPDTSNTALDDKMEVEKSGGEPEMAVENSGGEPEERDGDIIPDPDSMVGELHDYLAHISECIGSQDLEMEWILELNREAAEDDAHRDPNRPVAEEPDLLDEVESGGNEWAEYYDTTNGEPLDPQLVEQAKREELEYMQSLPTWTQIENLEPEDKPVSCKWVLTQKGPEEVRARLVACETKLFAPIAS